MRARSARPRLADILEATVRIRDEMQGVSLTAFESDWRKRWLVECGLEILSEASRHLPETMKARHPEIPWAKVAGIGNVLRHDYERVAAPVLWALVQADLLQLEAVCRAEFEAEQSID